MTDSLFLAMWNVENLFDVEGAKRPKKIRRIIAKDIAGWNEQLLDAKLRQLSIVIRSMNSGAGPDVLGVCEVENRNVLKKLADRISLDGGRTYSIAHADTSDNRGIDVAFLYDSGIMKTSHDKMFQHWVVKRYATRELFQVNFTIDGGTLVLIGNHWPSRSGGQYESEPYRMTAGETLSYWIERIHEELGEDAAIVVLGDFNDEPFNRALTEYALSINDSRVVLSGTSHYLLNLMWPLLAQGKGSHLFEGRWNMLDQIMVSRAVVNGKCGWTAQDSPRIVGAELMTHPTSRGPHRFGIKPMERDISGFSDHYPVSITLKKENRIFRLSYG